MAELDRWIEWANDKAGFLQVVGTAVLALITWRYVRLTARLVHAPHQARVALTLIRPKVGEVHLRVLDHGPAPALGVRVCAFVLEAGRVCTGSLDIQVDDRIVDPGLLKGTLVPSHPVVLCWKTLDGKRHRSYWAEGEEGQPVHLTASDRFTRCLTRLVKDRHIRRFHRQPKQPPPAPTP